MHALLHPVPRPLILVPSTQQVGHCLMQPSSGARLDFLVITQDYANMRSADKGVRRRRRRRHCKLGLQPYDDGQQLAVHGRDHVACLRRPRADAAETELRREEPAAARRREALVLLEQHVVPWHLAAVVVRLGSPHCSFRCTMAAHPACCRSVDATICDHMRLHAAATAATVDGRRLRQPSHRAALAGRE